jgi:hypothetical protein
MPRALAPQEVSIAQVLHQISKLANISNETIEMVKETQNVVLQVKGRAGFLPRTYAEKLM